MVYYPEGCYNEKHEWMPTHGQRCKCRLVWIEEPCAYCSHIPDVAPKAPKEVKEVTRESLRAAANERLDRVRAEKIQELHEEARAAATSPTPLPAQKHKKKRAPRRTPAEIDAWRAKKEAERQKVALLVEPSWLDASDPVTDAIIAGEDVEEAMEFVKKYGEGE